MRLKKRRGEGSDAHIDGNGLLDGEREDVKSTRLIELGDGPAIGVDPERGLSVAVAIDGDDVVLGAFGEAPGAGADGGIARVAASGRGLATAAIAVQSAGIPADEDGRLATGVAEGHQLPVSLVPVVIGEHIDGDLELTSGALRGGRGWKEGGGEKGVMIQSHGSRFARREASAGAGSSAATRPHSAIAPWKPSTARPMGLSRCGAAHTGRNRAARPASGNCRGGFLPVCIHSAQARAGRVDSPVR